MYGWLPSTSSQLLQNLHPTWPMQSQLPQHHIDHWEIHGKERGDKCLECVPAGTNLVVICHSCNSMGGLIQFRTGCYRVVGGSGRGELAADLSIRLSLPHQMVSRHRVSVSMTPLSLSCDVSHPSLTCANIVTDTNVPGPYLQTVQ